MIASGQPNRLCARARGNRLCLLPTLGTHPASGRKKADGKSHKEALRALKRRDSDAVYRQLIADTNRHAPQR